jgi:DNA-directed RNA polymerase specialized sigma24 family protein
VSSDRCSARAKTRGTTLEQLHARHGLSLYALAYGIVIDPLEAEEVVRESLAELTHEIATGERRSVYAWLAARVRSRALGAVRARAWPPRSRETPISSDMMEGL